MSSSRSGGGTSGSPGRSGRKGSVAVDAHHQPPLHLFQRQGEEFVVRGSRRWMSTRNSFSHRFTPVCCDDLGHEIAAPGRMELAHQSAYFSGKAAKSDSSMGTFVPVTRRLMPGRRRRRSRSP